MFRTPKNRNELNADEQTKYDQLSVERRKLEDQKKEINGRQNAIIAELKNVLEKIDNVDSELEELTGTTNEERRRKMEC